MNNENAINSKNVGNQNIKANRMNSSNKIKKKKDASLPWWVELLFVQIGLPDKFLVKILKGRKKSLEILKKEKKYILILLSTFILLVYFYPVVKHAKNKLDCEAVAKKYIIKNRNISKFNQRELNMISTNFCSGGEKIYEIENLKK